MELSSSRSSSPRCPSSASRDRSSSALRALDSHALLSRVPLYLLSTFYSNKTRDARPPDFTHHGARGGVLGRGDALDAGGNRTVNAWSRVLYNNLFGP
eukprot:scaffold28048_cov60-Phaeocystis_antarctica.AAC.5